MIIDIILDRKDGEHYNARDFYYGVMDYENNLDNNYPISIAMDSGTNDDVIRALCNYVIIMNIIQIFATGLKHKFG